ncbi:hypothetical protein [Vibrio sp. MA40-2]|uniref:hypothetical protein n=1 Tax=Vibrio sp. MA40-2 TaxID=3391828 RepID=UPI0039A56F75
MPKSIELYIRLDFVVANHYMVIDIVITLGANDFLYELNVAKYCAYLGTNPITHAP